MKGQHKIDYFFARYGEKYEVNIVLSRKQTFWGSVKIHPLLAILTEVFVLNWSWLKSKMT